MIRHGAVNFGFSIDAAARRRLPRIVVAALAMGGLLWLMARFAPAGTKGFADAVVLGVMISVGMAIYGLHLALSGVITWKQVVKAIGQTTPADLRE